MKQIGQSIASILIVIFSIIIMIFFSKLFPYEFSIVFLILGIIFGFLIANYFMKINSQEKIPVLKNKHILLYGGGITLVFLISTSNLYEKNKIKKEKINEYNRILDRKSPEELLNEVDVIKNENEWTEQNIERLRIPMLTDENREIARIYNVDFNELIECYIDKIITQYTVEEVEEVEEFEKGTDELVKKFTELAKECISSLQK